MMNNSIIATEYKIYNFYVEQIVNNLEIVSITQDEFWWFDSFTVLSHHVIIDRLIFLLEGMVNSNIEDCGYLNLPEEQKIDNRMAVVDVLTRLEYSDDFIVSFDTQVAAYFMNSNNKIKPTTPGYMSSMKSSTIKVELKHGVELDRYFKDLQPEKEPIRLVNKALNLKCSVTNAVNSVSGALISVTSEYAEVRVLKDKMYTKMKFALDAVSIGKHSIKKLTRKRKAVIPVTGEIALHSYYGTVEIINTDSDEFGNEVITIVPTNQTFFLNSNELKFSTSDDEFGEMHRIKEQRPIVCMPCELIRSNTLTQKVQNLVNSIKAGNKHDEYQAFSSQEFVDSASMRDRRGTVSKSFEKTEETSPIVSSLDENVYVLEPLPKLTGSPTVLVMGVDTQRIFSTTPYWLNRITLPENLIITVPKYNRIKPDSSKYYEYSSRFEYLINESFVKEKDVEVMLDLSTYIETKEDGTKKVCYNRPSHKGYYDVITTKRDLSYRYVDPITNIYEMGPAVVVFTQGDGNIDSENLITALPATKVYTKNYANVFYDKEATVIQPASKVETTTETIVSRKADSIIADIKQLGIDDVKYKLVTGGGIVTVTKATDSWNFSITMQENSYKVNTQYKISDRAKELFANLIATVQ